MQMMARGYLPQNRRSWEYACERVLEEKSLWNPDEIVDVPQLCANEDGTISIPNVGSAALTPWSRQQLASALGVRWPRWFEKVSGGEQAEEINRRLARYEGSWKLRTRTARKDERDGAQVLGAIVSPTYTPIADERVLMNLVQSVDDAWLNKLCVSQAEFSDRSTHLCILDSTPAVIGAGNRREEFYAGFYIRNSQVGFTALTVHVFFMRLACSNGLLVTEGQFCLLYRTHRPIADEALCTRMSRVFGALDDCWRQGLQRLDDSRRQPVEQIEETISGLLRRVPGFGQHRETVLKNLEADGLFTSRFSIVQALTLVAKSLPHPDQRFEMERLAGNWLFDEMPGIAA